MARERDSQRQRLYNAQADAWKSLEEGATRRTFPRDFSGIREVQDFVNKVVKTPMWKKLCNRPVRAKEVPNRYFARGYLELIEIPPWAMTKGIVLHEMAHCALQHIDYHAADHGAEFVLILRRLVEQEMGEEARRDFDLCLEARGVRWGTDSRRLRDRLAV